jgi:hypothetical protein
VEWIEGNQVFRRGGDGPEIDFWEYEDLRGNAARMLSLI